MMEHQKIRPAKVIGPLGEPLTLDTLPPPCTTRWVVRRKAEVVAAVNGGLLSTEDVCARYPDARAEVDQALGPDERTGLAAAARVVRDASHALDAAAGK